MKKVPKSSQKSPLRLARTSPSIAALNGLARRGGSETVPGAAVGGEADVGGTLRQEPGDERDQGRDGAGDGEHHRLPAAGLRDRRQSGRKIRVPVAVLAVRSP